MIRTLEWAPLSSVVRLAPGSDNWPFTWARDDVLYTAYGDGRGFRPFVAEKLSMGFARVEGDPPRHRGVNVRSPTGEARGGGPAGEKASGILEVGGVLWLWIRNAGASRLASSRDGARTWRRCDWRFQETFGAPTFLQFGRGYEGARDDHVYVYSFDSPDAYTASDRMVLARVDRRSLSRRDAWEFFVRTDERGEPVWTRDIERRGAVLRHRGRCYRSGVSWCAPLRRYLWVQVLPGAPDRARRTRDRDPRFSGGFGVYDAPEPWGPWTTVWFTERWDTGPGESASFPTKWMDSGGEALWLAFSGEDSLSVRRAKVVLRKPRAASR